MKKYLKYEMAHDILMDGGEVFTRRITHTGKRGQTVYSAREWRIVDRKDISRYVHWATIEKLQRNKIIMRERPYSVLQQCDKTTLTQNENR